jgi:hypothetical protein
MGKNKRYVSRALRIAASAALTSLLLGCGSESGEREIPDSHTSDVLVCGTHNVIGPDGTVREAPTWFNVAGINAKLRYYPELAEAFGRSQVTSCDEAKAYTLSYAAFSQEHPGFDFDQPFEPRRPPPLPDDALPEGSTIKISGGNLKQLAPVVEIVNATGGCTGTFIAKNWIVTAAHCLNIGSGTTPKAEGYYPYTIKWSDNAGLVRRKADFRYVLQYVSPSYTGDFGPYLPAAGIGTDFALLYISETYDGWLPPGAPGLSDFMRVSLAGFASSSAEAWGWGQPIDSLASTSISNHQPIQQVSTDPSVIQGTIPSAPPYVCHGDSGGPLLDKYFLPAADGGQVAAIVASFVGGSTSTPTSPCFDKAGKQVYWARLDQQFRFIRSAQRQWYGPNWDCKLATETGSLGTKIAQCAPAPCQADADCASIPNTHCAGASASITACGDVCGTGGGCDCIYGKCLPNYDPNAP